MNREVDMKIAIHRREKNFSIGWIEYCEKSSIPFKLVDCYSNDILKQIEDCDIIMWHWSHTDFAAAFFARQLTYSLEKMNKKVFPDSNSCRFFDDKVGQRYFFEAMEIPHVPTYIFYNKEEAMKWVEEAKFPKVFKLSKGAGSANVRLVKKREDARKLVKQAFGKGFKTITYFNPEATRKVIKAGSFSQLINNVKKVPKYLLRTIKSNSFFGNQKGYIYFQDFIDGNDSDTRIVVIGKKAFSISRKCSKGDFRASGSGIKDFKPDNIDKRCVEIAMSFSKTNSFQSMAYDFIFIDGSPVVVEMSYCFESTVYPGYFDENLEWRNEITDVYKEMIDNLISSK